MQSPGFTPDALNSHSQEGVLEIFVCQTLNLRTPLVEQAARVSFLTRLYPVHNLPVALYCSRAGLATKFAGIVKNENVGPLVKELLRISSKSRAVSSA